MENLPEAFVYLIRQVCALKDEIQELRKTVAPSKPANSPFISTKEACAMLGECKNSLYEKARNGLIPAYKTPGGRTWKFLRHELLEYLANHKPKKKESSYDDMVAEMNQGLRPGRRNYLAKR